MSLLLVAVVWGSSYSVAKTALSFVPVLLFLFVRFALTSALLLPVVWRKLAADLPGTLRVGVPLGGVLFMIFVSETAGVAHTTAANAAFLISLCVVLTPVVEGIMFRRFPGWGTLGAAGLSCVGAGLLALENSYRFNLGDLLMLAAALLRALMVTTTKKLTQGRTLDSGALTAVQLITVAVLTGAALLVTGGQGLSLPTAPQFWGSTIYLCLFCTLMAFYIQTHMVRLTTPTRVSLLMGTEPVFGALFAMMLLGERVSAQGMLGGGLIVAATYYGIRRENARRGDRSAEQPA
ncbi:DMT family transporter [Sorangium sp. So ce448]|uniref:DMT family transporter n=1 Tax=Sorangium sp. So ce448 TaxID=3133314 RepID=UPI003F5D72C8